MSNLTSFVGLTFFTAILLFVGGLYTAETTTACYEQYDVTQLENITTRGDVLAFQNEINACIEQFAFPWWVWAFFLTPIGVGLAIYITPFIGG